MASFIGKFLNSKKINDIESEETSFRQIKVKPKNETQILPSKEIKPINSRFINNDIEDIVLYKKNIKYNCDKGKFENLLLYELDYIDTEFLRNLLFSMNNQLDLIKLSENENFITMKKKKEGLIKCINIVQKHIDFRY